MIKLPRKEIVVKSSAPKKIVKIQFSTLQNEEIQKAGEFEVSCKDLFVENGCMDPRLGISDKISLCKTCNKKLAECAGHFGYINLKLPVYHAGYFKHTLTILQCICKKCSAVLLSPQYKSDFLRKLRNPNLGSLAKGVIFKSIVEQCKKTSVCPYCGYCNGKLKKTMGLFKITHERAKVSNKSLTEADGGSDFMRGGGGGGGSIHADMSAILQYNPELRSLLVKDMELINPQRAYQLLKNITEEDMNLLWMDTEFSRADTLIQWVIPVPPVPIRPSVPQALSGGTTEDDITIKLREIVEINNELRRKLNRGDHMRDIALYWEELQIRAALLINGDAIPRLNGEKKIRGIYQRLKGKQGRLRGNLSGKRVDFSGRTVISPDPNLKIEQVGVPELVAKEMTYPERANRYNIEELRRAVLNGPEVHPGAVIVRSEVHQYLLQFADRARVATNLKIGDIVERHMKDDDVVLFNRQPSLHKMSIMAHRVKVFPYRTFRFNECCCTPYNADFDGDEMNLHLPQTEEAKAEAAELMLVSRNLISPRNGEPLIAATQDFLTGAYILTQKDVYFNKSDFCRLLAYLSDANELITLPPPTIWKPRLLWTGKQVISILVQPNLVNVESEEKFYNKKDKHFCDMDGFVAFRKGELVCGNLGKKTLGADSKAGLFYVLIRDYGYIEATRCMSRLAKLCARFLGDRGFSIGISDVTPSPTMLELKQQILVDGQSRAENEIDAYNTGQIKLKPGCDALQSLESEVNGVLSDIREKIGNKALVALNIRNSPLCMAQCGSKGSTINISQMIACLGQQSVGGSRIQNGFVNRTLPHFPVLSLTPAAKGFVSNSFYTGLTATEFFFHTMGGREGLVDTAVKTAETGYMARRLMKALEDLSMQYDFTVRNSEKMVIQFSYGDDGLDPSLMEKGDRPVDYSRLMINVCSNETDIYEDTMLSIQVKHMVLIEIQSERFQALLPQGQQFLDETKKFFDTIAADLLKLEKIEFDHDVENSTTTTSTTTTTTDVMGKIDDCIDMNTTTATNNNNNTYDNKDEIGTKSTESPSKKENLYQLRQRLQHMSSLERIQWRGNAINGHLPEYSEMNRLLRNNVIRLTYKQMKRILDLAYQKYVKSMTPPGESVGAVGAQSLAEPSTQMTLKTFHFAGVASMNVTLGVPRLKEIINAAENISTPIVKATLVQPDSVTSARIVKSQLEKTTLGSVVHFIKEVHSPEQSYISIKLDMDLISQFHLNINAYHVKEAILYNIGRPGILKLLKEKHVVVTTSKANRLRILPPEAKDSDKGIGTHRRMYFMMQTLKAALPSVIVQGIHTVSRAVINKEKDKDLYYILVEGLGLEKVMGTPGVDGKNTVTNNIIETQKVLGIEAARYTIASEIKYIMNEYGITVDRRHLMLLSDVMTFKGQTLGITRFGVAKMRESVLTNASFEQTMDHLLDASVHARQDSLVGVSECIITGMPIPMGTGLFTVLHKPGHKIKTFKRTRLFDTI